MYFNYELLGKEKRLNKIIVGLEEGNRNNNRYVAYLEGDPAGLKIAQDTVDEAIGLLVRTNQDKLGLQVQFKFIEEAPKTK